MRPALRSRRRRAWPRRAARAGLLAIGVGVVWAGAPSAAQEPTIPGVTLTLVTEPFGTSPLALLPLETLGASPETAADVEAILARDLRYSSRFEVADSLPALWNHNRISYSFWNQFNVDWLLTGTLENVAGTRYLSLELHDVVMEGLRARSRFPLPAPDTEDFRMAVHRVSDQVVEWAFDEPGAAATRIVFSMPTLGDPGSKELYMADSDGENLQRLTWDSDIAVSPSWSPDGARVVYVSYKSGEPRVYELDIESRQERMLDPGRPGQQITPAYHPDGGEIAFSLLGMGVDGLYAYDFEQDCCLRRIAGGRSWNIQPSYSGSGERIAFVSSRLEGSAAPQVYTVSAEGGTPELLSPFRYGQGGYFTDPDWSPVDNQVAFVGGIRDRRVAAVYNLFIADLDRRDNRLVQLTLAGSSEDPSWAPDGRHLVFVRRLGDRYSLVVIDSRTRRDRVLVANVHRETKDTDWSPRLAR